ncbi:MAG TPA: SulP family inorganic anion transporter, partial [Thermomicrobiales bacterium]|nr:SulP family inorganic anion transporter [Thermomicrobiales bacterium]
RSGLVTSERAHAVGGRQSRDDRPLLGWLAGYDRGWLRADLLAGLAVWALVVPQAIAYAAIAGLPPHAGLYTTFAGLIGYALLGTSRQLVVSPTSSTAMISALLVAPLAVGSAEEYADLSAMLAIMLGVVFVLLGVWKMGFVSQFIATPVQVGMIFGLGMTIIVGQLGKILGVEVGEGTFVEQAAELIRNLDDTSGWTLAVGAGSLVALLALQRVLPGVPAALLVVTATIALSYLLDLSNRGVAVVGEVSSSFPLPSIPTASWDQFISLLPGVLVIAIIGYAESDTVAEQFASEHRYAIKPNRELLALGAANGLSGLFQGFITGGGASQSAANDRAGARTQLAAFAVAILTLVTIVALLPIFEELPTAVLGAIVISAVLGFIRVREMKRIRDFRRAGFVLAMVALLGVLILGVLPGLLIAIALSLLLLLSRLSRPRDSLLGRLAGLEAYVDIERNPDSASDPGLLIYRLNAPLLFVNATTLRERLHQKIDAAPEPISVVIVDLGFSDTIDIKATDTLLTLRDELGDSGIQFWLAEVHGGVIEMLLRDDHASQLTSAHCYRTVGEAVQAYRREFAPDLRPQA